MKVGLNLNVRNRNDETPLYMACHEGFKDIAEYLIDNGADIWVKSKIGDSGCLHAASKRGHVEVIRLLLQKGFDINSKEGHFGETPFLEACRYGQPKAIKMLLQNGANIRDLDKISNNALHIIAADNSEMLLPSLVETTNILLENGANVMLKKYGLFAPFHLAVKRPNLPFIKVLYDSYPNFDIKDHANNNAIEYVLTEKKQDAMKIILFHFHQQ